MPDDTDTTHDPTATRQRARKYRVYSDLEIAETLAALDANGGNVYATVRQTGVPETTIRQWAKGLCRPVTAELREQAKSVLSDHAETMVWKLLEHADENYERMHPSQAIVGAAILIDKIAVLRGEATQVIEHRDDSRQAELDARYGGARKLVLVVQPQPGELPPTSTEGAPGEATPAPQPPATSGPAAPSVSRPS